MAKQLTNRSRLLASGNVKPTVQLMPSFNQGDVNRVPFRYTDRPTTQHGPAASVIWLCKLAPIEARHAEPIGRVDPKLTPEFGEALRKSSGSRSRIWSQTSPDYFIDARKISSCGLAQTCIFENGP